MKVKRSSKILSKNLKILNIFFYSMKYKYCNTIKVLMINSYKKRLKKSSVKQGKNSNVNLFLKMSLFKTTFLRESVTTNSCWQKPMEHCQEKNITAGRLPFGRAHCSPPRLRYLFFVKRKRVDCQELLCV